MLLLLDSGGDVRRRRGVPEEDAARRRGREEWLARAGEGGRDRDELMDEEEKRELGEEGAEDGDDGGGERERVMSLSRWDIEFIVRERSERRWRGGGGRGELRLSFGGWLLGKHQPSRGFRELGASEFRDERSCVDELTWFTSMRSREIVVLEGEAVKEGGGGWRREADEHEGFRRSKS